MRNATCLTAALGLVALTAGCMQDATYPSTAYNAGYSTAYSPGYTSTYSPGYSTAYSSGYTNTAAARSDRYWNSSRRDYDHDGIPNGYDRDANGDGIPDRYQGRPAPR
jgi:hypothetical protein